MFFSSSSLMFRWVSSVSESNFKVDSLPLIQRMMMWHLDQRQRKMDTESTFSCCLSSLYVHCGAPFDVMYMYINLNTLGFSSVHIIDIFGDTCIRHALSFWGLGAPDSLLPLKLATTITEMEACCGFSGCSGLSCSRVLCMAFASCSLSGLWHFCCIFPFCFWHGLRMHIFLVCLWCILCLIRLLYGF